MSTSLKEWLHKVKDKPVPVLHDTVSVLKTLCSNEKMPTERIVDIIMQDPGMMLQLLRQCNEGKKLKREVTSVQQAVMLVGTEKLMSMAKALPTIKETLDGNAKQQILRTYTRAHHAATQAIDWAQQRRDMNYDEVASATQLHFLGEMIVSIYEPDLLIQIFKMRAEKHIASEEAQYLILGFTLDQLSLVLAEEWHLPELVIESLHAESSLQARGYAITLAVQLARATSISWYSEKTFDIIEQAADLLDRTTDSISREVTQLAIQCARSSNVKSVLQAAALLPMLPIEPPAEETTTEVDEDVHAGICLTPQSAILKGTLENLKAAIAQKKSKEEILKIGLEGLHDGIGLNRVVYAVHEKEQKALVAKIVFGADNDPAFNRFNIRLDTPHLFTQLMNKTQAICINDENRKQFWPIVPPDFAKLIGTNSFVTMMIVNKDEPVQLFYADRHTSDCQLDTKSYQIFKQMCGSVAKALAMVV